MATQLNRFHGRASRFLRELDAATSFDNSEKLEFIRWLQYELERRAAPLEPHDDASVVGSGNRWKLIYE